MAGHRQTLAESARRAAPAAVALSLLLPGCRVIEPHPGARHVEKVMLTTAYCPCGICCEWHRNWFGRPVYSSGRNRGKAKVVGKTANGAWARPGTIAADITRYPFGTVMDVPGYGRGRVEDVGGAIKGDHIDLFFRTHRQAERWGARYLRVKIWPGPEKAGPSISAPRR